MENPDSTDELLGDYLRRFFDENRRGNNAKAKEIMKRFPVAKKRMWDEWQREVNQYLPDVRKNQSELLERLAKGEATPPQNVATFLQTGMILTRTAPTDSQTLHDTAQYPRKLADDLARSQTPVVAH
jgi:hypothetical protein